MGILKSNYLILLQTNYYISLFVEDLEQLKRYRENNERKSREVVQIWEDSISSNIHNLGKESKHTI